MENLRVVVRFGNGRRLKGTTQDFKPLSPRFHLIPAEGGELVEVRLDELKAVFFVRDLAGTPSRPKLRGFVEAPAETAQGKKVAVRFADGELLCGYTLAYSSERKGFFLFPADREGNNERVYVVTAAAAQIEAGPAAERLAEKVLARR
jgi:Family of unknown function (DUF6982)